MWSEGIIASPTTDAKFKYWVKHFEKGSEWGIDSGRISKLTIRKLGESHDLVNFDRGWDVEVPDDSEVQAVYAILLEKYN
jgi:hypothetical protein